ncbi:hypothetical protein SBDP1_790008 [Syntrophobacter sp. SbD1]|nr:hypothetical protein SBDP1_790008 [Syntrophobacter sp. SbD1]
MVSLQEIAARARRSASSDGISVTNPCSISSRRSSASSAHNISISDFDSSSRLSTIHFASVARSFKSNFLISASSSSRLMWFSFAIRPRARERVFIPGLLFITYIHSFIIGVQHPVGLEVLLRTDLHSFNVDSAPRFSICVGSAAFHGGAWRFHAQMHPSSLGQSAAMEGGATRVDDLIFGALPGQIHRGLILEDFALSGYKFTCGSASASIRSGSRVESRGRRSKNGPKLLFFFAASRAPKRKNKRNEDKSRTCSRSAQ